MMKKELLILCLILPFKIMPGQANIPKPHEKCLPAIVKITGIKHDGLGSEGAGFFY